jgi:serpin B
MPLEAGFSFVAILPEEGITAKEYLSTLTSEKAGRLLSEETYCAVKTRIPQFQLDYAIDLKEVMPVMGLHTGYHPTQADFSAMIEIPDHNVYIYESIQKTHFELDQNGIKAAAVTAIVMDKASEGMMGKEIELFLDRPFVYMLIHESSGIVLFEGIMNDLSA